MSILMHIGNGESWIPYLLRGTLAASVPVALTINVGDSCALVHGVEGQEMHLSDSCSCLRCHKRDKVKQLCMGYVNKDNFFISSC